MNRIIRLNERELRRLISESAMRLISESAIYKDGEQIGEQLDNGSVYWFYSDGEAGGANGGHLMDKYEADEYNGMGPEYNPEDYYVDDNN